MSDAFDLDAVFDDDYLHCYEPYLSGEHDDRDAALIAGLLSLVAGERVLDVCCGHGRIAVRLAALGCEVTGLDRSTPFLERARALAAERGATVAWRRGDVRELGAEAEFDAAVCWFTSFGYHDDEVDRDVLRRLRRALRPGGRLLLETVNLFAWAMDDAEQSVKRRGRDLMVDEQRFDPVTGRLSVERVVVRDGRERPPVSFTIRLFSCTELAGWLRDAGFDEVAAYGGDGEPFGVDSERLVLVAR